MNRFLAIILSKYTTEELKEELKRRSTVNRLKSVKSRKPNDYLYVKGVVTKIIGNSFTQSKWQVEILPTEVQRCDIQMHQIYGWYKLKSGNFIKILLLKLETLFFYQFYLPRIGVSSINLPPKFVKSAKAINLWI